MTDLDEVLERFQLGALEYGGGLANHGPMAAEALCALGHSALLIGWVDLYAPRLPPLGAGHALDESEQQSALGDPSRATDWVATFERAVERDGWAEVVRAWLPLLAPGLFSSAGHGLLRVSHAVRALEASDSAPRGREVAFGLATWAARYQRLPGLPRSHCAPASEGSQDSTPASAARPADEVLRELEPVAVEARRTGFFFDAVKVLDQHEPYLRAVAEADLGAVDGEPRASGPHDVSSWISALCRESARLYLAHPESRIAYAHAITVPSALRFLLPHADATTQSALLGAGFQAVAALHAVSGERGRRPAAPEPEVEALARDPHEIRYRAACSLEEHSIKLAEACLRENAIESNAVLQLAAADAACRIEGPGARRC